MKKSTLITLFVLVGILACLTISPAMALTPKGYWGMSEGDQLYYKVTANNTGSEVVTYARVDITSIYNGTYVFPYNFINATTYVYTGTAWVQSYVDTQWAGYNATWGWFGAAYVSVGFPNPAPLLPLIGFSWLLVNYTIYYWLNITWMGSIQSYFESSNTVAYTNSSEEFFITYQPSTGICTNNTHKINGNLWTKQEYIGEDDPFPPAPPPPAIPGYSPILIVTMLGITTLLIGWKIKKK